MNLNHFNLFEMICDDINGVLYCMWNKMFSVYGENVFKLGRTSCIKNRMNSYATSYIDACECKYVSERVFKNSDQAERLLFFMLRGYRIKKSREFFDLELKIIVETMKKIERMKDETITKLYNKMMNNFLNERIIKEIENAGEEEEDYEEDDVKITNMTTDLFFEKFKFQKNK